MGSSILCGKVEVVVGEILYGTRPGPDASFDLIRLVAPFVLVEPAVRMEESLPASPPLSPSLILTRVSGYEIVIVGLNFEGVFPLAAAVNGSGCNEQTSLASAPVERSKAQKS